VENIALARQVAMYFLREKLGINLVEVAFLLKRRDHTTVMHGVEKIKQMIMKDTSFKEEIDRIGNSLQ
jgi:chromosomal replication initiator protein